MNLANMTDIKDLNIAKEIFPLFDYTNNDLASKVILGLMQTLPSEMEEVIRRQEILRAFTKNVRQVNPEYSRADFHQVYYFIGNFLTSSGENENLPAILQLFSSKKRQQRRG